MPGDPPEHRIVSPLHPADAESVEHILNPVGAMIAKYNDIVAVAALAFGPGLHLLARQPRRPIPAEPRQRAQSRARDDGVKTIACGNTLKIAGWTAADRVTFAKIEDVGAAARMQMQAPGWACMAWGGKVRK